MRTTKRKLTVKEWRVLQDRTQKEMADALGIHVNTYREYEAHQERITLGMIIAICDVLGIKTTELKLF